jgi:hypothetical protein
MNRIFTWSEHEDLTASVEAIFEKHCKLYRAPSRDDCRTIASALMAVRVTEDAEARRKDPTKAPIIAARKAAKDLLRNLKPIKRKLEVLIADAETTGLETMGLSDAGYREPLDRLDAAANAVEALLVELYRPPIVPTTHQDPIRFIAERVQEALAAANDAAATFGANHDGPLVKIVHDALSLVGMMGMLTAHAVSAVLSEKRRSRTRYKNRY